MVDGGSALMGDRGERDVLPFLWQEGVRRLDAVIVTHGDEDHAGGLEDVLASIPADAVLMGPPWGGRGAAERIRKAATSRALLREIYAGNFLEWAGVPFVNVRWPPKGGSLGPKNEASLVLSVSLFSTPILLMGDAGMASEEELIKLGLPRVGILKVGHHGSLSSTSQAFVQAIRPRLAVVSSGKRFNLPNEDVVQRLRAQGAEVFVTDEDGAVLIKKRGPGIQTEGFLSRRRIKWSP